MLRQLCMPLLMLGIVLGGGSCEKSNVLNTVNPSDRIHMNALISGAWDLNFVTDEAWGHTIAHGHPSTTIFGTMDGGETVYTIALYINEYVISGVYTIVDGFQDCPVGCAQASLYDDSSDARRTFRSISGRIVVTRFGYVRGTFKFSARNSVSDTIAVHGGEFVGENGEQL